MNITSSKKVIVQNISVTAKIEKSALKKEINKIAKRLAKRRENCGSRKGKGSSIYI